MVRKKSDPLPTPPARPTRLSIDLPPNVHLRFKLLCVANQQDMNNRVRELVEQDIAARAHRVSGLTGAR